MLYIPKLSNFKRADTGDVLLEEAIVLYLNQRDIQSLVHVMDLLEVVENAMIQYEAGTFVMPDRIHVHHGVDTYLYMPCFTDSSKGTKILTLYPGNAQKGTAVIQGMMLLNDSETGAVKALLDGAALTAYRTGAVGGVGIKYTTPKDATKLGIVGTGVQAFYQCLNAVQIRPIETILLFNRNKEKAEIFSRQLQSVLPEIEIIVCEEVSAVVNGAEIIITTTTALEPVLPDDEALLKGKHFIGIGSYKPTMREYPNSLYQLLDQVYCDVDFAKVESGDLRVPLEKGLIQEAQIKTLGKTIQGGKINVHETTLYKSVGMALFDLCVAEHLYQKALRLGIGQHIQT